MRPALLRKKTIPAVLLVVVLVVLFANERMFEWIYPIKYEEEIEHAAQEYGVDKFLLAAIIRTESNYRPDKVSAKGAVGLMQIMPETADWIAKGEGMDVPLGDRLFEPELNIRLGALYIRLLTQQFASRAGGDGEARDGLAIIAAAYNAGPGAVGRWLSDGTWSGLYRESGQIPYGETRHFVERVLYYYNKYRQVYDGK
jgi:soluble lytic murein transglycosylase